MEFYLNNAGANGGEVGGGGKWGGCRSCRSLCLWALWRSLIKAIAVLNRGQLACSSIGRWTTCFVWCMVWP